MRQNLALRAAVYPAAHSRTFALSAIRAPTLVLLDGSRSDSKSGLFRTMTYSGFQFGYNRDGKACGVPLIVT